jgi:hypothetical protein
MQSAAMVTAHSVFHGLRFNACLGNNNKDIQVVTATDNSL